MPNQYSDAAAGDTTQELTAWAAQRKALLAAHPDPASWNQADADVFNGKNLSAAAQQMAQKGNGSERFDPDKGEMVKTGGYFSHPESWIQLGLGGGLVGAGLAGALPGALGGATGGASQAAAAAPAAAVTGGVGGGTTAATVAGGAAAAAPKAAGGIGSWLTSPAGQLLNAGIAEGGNIFAGIKQAGAEKEAAALQDKQFQQALEAQKEQEQYGRNNYAAYLSRLQGFADTGNAANGRLASFMGQGAMPTNTQGPPLHPSATPPQPLPPSSPGGPMAAPFQPPPQGAPMGQQGQTVKMAGPDGSVRDIPADQVQKYTQLGAKLVQAGA